MNLQNDFNKLDRSMFSVIVNIRGKQALYGNRSQASGRTSSKSKET